LREKRVKGGETTFEFGEINVAFVVENWRFQADVALIVLLVEVGEERGEIDDAFARMEIVAAAIEREAIAAKILDMDMTYAVIQPEPGSIEDLSHLVVKGEKLGIESNVAA
jgi:hypothetical protein